MTTEETIISSFDSLQEESEKKPHLTFIKGPRLGQLYALDQHQQMVVGRSPDCDLWIEDNAISRRHFKILIKDAAVFLEDLGSTNGTYVNGQRVKNAILADGDKIQISQDTLLELTYIDKTRSLSDKKLYEMGVKDPVTDTFNKRYLLDRLKEEFSFARRNKRKLSLLMFDIDHFKKLNDTHGHLAGDLALQKMAAEIMGTIRSEDIFARYGGEEFVILMRDMDLNGSMGLGERLRKFVSDLEIEYEGKKIKITISSGVAIQNDSHRDYLALIAEADKFLYQSKNEGRNRVSGPAEI